MEIVLVVRILLAKYRADRSRSASFVLLYSTVRRLLRFTHARSPVATSLSLITDGDEFLFCFSFARDQNCSDAC